MTETLDVLAAQVGSGSSSCAGACCAIFPMDGWAVERMRKGDSNILDGDYIADMLIDLTYDEAVERYARLGYGTFPDVYPSREDFDRWGKKLYTCRHWNEETRLCGAYDSRPGMCREYPYGSKCERGCGYEYDPNPTPFVWDEAANGWAVGANAKWDWDGTHLRAKDAPTRTGPKKPPRQAP